MRWRGGVTLEAMRRHADPSPMPSLAIDAGRRRAEARTAALAVAAALGCPPAVLTRRKHRSKGPPPARFRHPEDPGVTWNGRGNPPRWYDEAIERGVSLARLRIRDEEDSQD